MPTKKYTLTTKEGCKKLFALFIVIIFVVSLIGQLIQTNCGSIKIERINFDARGSELNGELYTPAGVSSKDKLPGVVVTHGGGCGFGVTRGIAYELARRGFVVFNVSAYGSGASTMPRYDENGNGEEGLVIFMSPMGLLDAVNYLRSLPYVDPTRVGLIGHSMGAGRSATTALTDCGYYTFNDIMINVLADDFGQTFTEEEIYEDADTLAAERLDDGQLALYEHIRAEKKEYYDTRLHAVILMGLDMVPLYAGTATVAGYEVPRNVNCNVAYFSGEYDSFWSFPTKEETKASWYANGKDLAFETWYGLDDQNAANTEFGKLYEVSAADNAGLKAAFDSRTARITALATKETHSRDFLSTKMTSLISKYFEQTLGYNRGELGAAGSAPIDARSNSWYWRQVCNAIAMFAMFGMIVALAGILFRTDAFSPCVNEVEDSARPKLDKKATWIGAIATIVLSFLAIYLALGSSGLVSAMWLTPNDAFPIVRNAFMTGFFLIELAVMSVIIVCFYCFYNKKKGLDTGFKALNVKTKFVNALKYIAAAIILIAAAYGSLAVIDYFFGQDYRFWMTIFTVMKADYWFIALRYAIPFFLLYLVISCGVNYSVRTDIPAWKDDLYAIVINSAGIWLCALINYLIVYFNGYQGVFFCNFFIAYQVVLIVPLTVFISRKLYRLTNSIWPGAALNALLVSWSLASAAGIGDVYIAQTWLGNFLNF